MEPTSEVDATKILEKGPEYLRKQMELESETKGGGMSAVERLAASKPKYVKSQQVVKSTQQPVLSFGSASVGSTGSSNRSSTRGGKPVPGRSSPPVATGGTRSRSPGQDNAVRRSSSKKRPDSLLLYRQKCELLKGSTSDRNKRNIARRLLRAVDKNGPLPEATDKESGSEGGNATCVTPEGSNTGEASRQITRRSEVAEEESRENSDPANKPVHRRVAEVQRRCRALSRSHSDVSSRYSKHFTDFDAFFKYCGLDGEVVESLGRENFSARSDELAINIRSVSVSTSDDGFCRSSGGGSDGLLEDELQETFCRGTSVIERNARIIKWLYSCKNSKETGKKFRELH